MGHPINSTMRDLDGKKICEVFGHKARRYGNGIFCENCEQPMNEEDVKEVVIHRNSEPKPSWMKKYPGFR